MNLREEYKRKIDDLTSATFSDDQKELAKRMLDFAPDKELTQWYQLIIQKIKTGFKFDAAPEVAQDSVAILVEDEEKRINVEDSPSENENLLIIGENYEALKNLLITHKNEIDIIYIDPPYNTEKTKEDGNHLGTDSNVSANKFIYRDKYSRTGWLNMMNERLQMAKQLLSDDGFIFVSIDDIEHAYLKVLMDEIFGEENFVANLNPLDNLKGKTNDNFISMTSHYIVTYAKNAAQSKGFVDVPLVDTPFAKKYNLFDEKGSYSLMSFKKTGADKMRTDRPFSWFPILASKSRLSMITDAEYFSLYDANAKAFKDDALEKIVNKYKSEGWEIILPISGTEKLRWTSNFESTKKLIENNELVLNSNDGISMKNRPSEVELREQLVYGRPKNNFYAKEFSLGTNQLKDLGLSFDNPKSVNLIQYLIELTGMKNATVLDFFAGSGTTGHAVMNLNKINGGRHKFILCTNNENQIGESITFERMYRTINGIGTKGQKDFNWIKQNKPFLGEKLRVFKIENHSCSINDDISDIEEKAIKSFLKIKPAYNVKSELDIYYDLNSLHPQKGAK